jgi:hypothetical protein
MTLKPNGYELSHGPYNSQQFFYSSQLTTTSLEEVQPNKPISIN